MKQYIALLTGVLAVTMTASVITCAEETPAAERQQITKEFMSLHRWRKPFWRTQP